MLIEGEVDAPISPEMANLQISLGGQNLSRWDEALDMELPALPKYQLAGRLRLVEHVWSIEQMIATVANSDVTGLLRITPDADPLHIEGNLHSDQLDLVQLQEFIPQQEDSDPLEVQAAAYIDLIASTNWHTNITYRADLIETEEFPIKDTKIVMMLKENVLTLETLSGAVAGTQVHIEGDVSAEENLAEGRIRLLLKKAQLPEVSNAATALSSGPSAIPGLTGNLTGELTVTVKATRSPVENTKPVTAKDGNLPHRAEVSSIAIQNLDLGYADPSSNTKIVAHLDETMSDNTMVIQADGAYRSEPIELSLTLPALQSLVSLSPDDPLQRLALDLKLPNANASVMATMMLAWPPTKMDLRFNVESDKPATTAALLGLELPTIGQLAMSGSLSRQGDIWKINKFKTLVGDSNIYGRAVINTSKELKFEAMLKSNKLDLAVLTTTTDTDSSQSAPSHVAPSESNFSESVSTKPASPPWLTELNGKIGLTVQQLILPGVTLGDVSLRAAIDDGLLSIEPLTIALGEGIIKTRVKLDLAAPTLAGRLQTKIRSVDLAKVMQAVGRETTALGTISGRIALSLPLTRQSTGDLSNADALLERLRVEEVRLRYDDPALQTKTDLRLKTDSIESQMHVNGTVEYQGIPVEISLTTGSVREGIEDYTSLPVKATLDIKQTTIDIESTVGRILPLESLTTSLSMAGPDLFRLGDAINIPLPHLPPYDLHANLQRKQLDSDQQIFIFKNLEGTIGDSDVAGKLHVTTGGERPMIFTRLQSRKLDLDDLAGLTGAPPDPNETASAKQKEQAEKFENRDRLLPDKPIDFTQLQNVDADVEYRAKEVQAPKLPIDNFLLKMNLEDGHLQMNRLDFGVANGVIAMELEVNARNLPVQAKVNTDFDQVNLSRLLASVEMADDSFGKIGGRATLWMQGDSLAKWFSSADGGLYLTMTGGNIDALLVELAGLDFTESAVVFLGTDAEVPIDCAYADLQARSGIVTIKPFIFDTKDTKFKGYGKIDLRQEQLDVTVKPYPKDFTFLSSRGPLSVTGMFTKPSFSVDPSFPSPEFGTADDSARCKGMIDNLREARKNGMDKRSITFDPVE